MDLQLTNKKALVTGSTAGIGFAIASLLAQEGASVEVNGRSQQRVEQAVRRIRTGERRGVSPPREHDYSLMEITTDPARLERGKQFVTKGLADGSLKPIIAKTFPLEQIVEAHRYLESNQQIGKNIVTLRYRGHWLRRGMWDGAGTHL